MLVYTLYTKVWFLYTFQKNPNGYFCRNTLLYIYSIFMYVLLMVSVAAKIIN